MATVTVRGKFVQPEKRDAAKREKVIWVDPAGGLISIRFTGQTPLEWKSNSGSPVIGTVRDDAAVGIYKYKVGESLASELDQAMADLDPLSADPEIIVSGGPLMKSVRPTSTRRAKPAAKRAKAKGTKRTKATKGTKAAKRTKAVKRTKAAKRAKPARRATSTKRVKAKRAKKR